jgi:outer membrane protein TolC
MNLRNWLCILSLPAVAAAQPLSSLVDEALHNNREILAAQKKYEAARQRPGQAGSLRGPTVSLGYTSNGAPYPVAGLGRDVTSNAGVMVSQEVPFPGKQKLRGEIAARQADAEFQEYLTVRLSVVARLKQVYYELHHAIQAIVYTTRDQELLQGMPWAGRHSRIFLKRRRSSPFSRRSCCATNRNSAASRSKSTRC